MQACAVDAWLLLSSVLRLTHLAAQGCACTSCCVWQAPVQVRQVPDCRLAQALQHNNNAELSSSWHHQLLFGAMLCWHSSDQERNMRCLPAFQLVPAVVATSCLSKPPARTLAGVLLQTGGVLDTAAASTVHQVTEPVGRQAGRQTGSFGRPTRVLSTTAHVLLPGSPVDQRTLLQAPWAVEASCQLLSDHVHHVSMQKGRSAAAAAVELSDQSNPVVHRFRHRSKTIVELLVKTIIDWLLAGAGAAAGKVTGFAGEAQRTGHHNNTRAYILKNATSWQKGREKRHSQLDQKLKISHVSSQHC